MLYGSIGDAKLSVGVNACVCKCESQAMEWGGLGKALATYPKKKH